MKMLKIFLKKSKFNLQYQYLRTYLYSDYDTMDTDAIVASALDIISDECTLKNDMGEVLQIKSSDDDIQKILYNLFYDVLNIEFNLWSWTRQMCKYGDFFQWQILQPQQWEHLETLHSEKVPTPVM